jgi:toxin FitB
LRGWLLDTNVVSEWSKTKPEDNVIAAVSAMPMQKCFISNITILELKQGLESMRSSAKKTLIGNWLNDEFLPSFSSRIISIDDHILGVALNIVQHANVKRFNPGFADTLIAATAIDAELVVVSRNVKDFKFFGVPVLNPFTGDRFNGA